MLPPVCTVGWDRVEDQACISACPTGALLEIPPEAAFIERTEGMAEAARGGFDHTAMVDAAQRNEVPKGAASIVYGPGRAGAARPTRCGARQAGSGKADDDGIIACQHQVDADDLQEGDETLVGEDFHSVPSSRGGVSNRAVAGLLLAAEIGASQDCRKSGGRKTWALPDRAGCG